jgi:hypothetical protein
VQPGSVRAVEYEILSSNQADTIGLTPSKLRNELGGLSARGAEMRRSPVQEAHRHR